jgi:hypothetical protein
VYIETSRPDMTKGIVFFVFPLPIVLFFYNFFISIFVRFFTIFLRVVQLVFFGIIPITVLQAPSTRIARVGEFNGRPDLIWPGLYRGLYIVTFDLTSKR